LVGAGARCGRNWSGWSAAVTVTVLPPAPAKPVLSSPANASLTKDKDITFTWNAVDNGVSYHLQVAGSSRFSDGSLLLDQDGLTEPTFTPADPATVFPNDGKYYWRVQAKNANDVYGGWSKVYSFTIDTIAPTVPTLSYPANGSAFTGTPTFKWVRPSGATQFEFQYNDADNTDTYIYNSGLTNRNTHTPAEMQTGTQFYWFVRAYDKAGNKSEWSAPFTVTILAPIPARPSLSAPTNGSLTNEDTPTLTWSAVDYAAGYDIQIASSSRFSADSLVQTADDEQGRPSRLPA
jgi:predicted phage tail protein